MSWDDVKDWLHRLDAEGDDLVASSAGAAPDTLPQKVRRYVEHHGVPDEELVLAAFRAVERIGMQRDEHDDALVDLEERLGAILSA